MTPRIAAYETLLLCEKEKQYSNIAINNGITRYHFDGRDRDLYTRLVYGVIEKQLTLDYLIQQYTEKSIKRLDKPVVLILRLSLYQIKFLERIPNSAAVSEGVKLASRFASRAKGYINAILRRACVEEVEYPHTSDCTAYASVFYSINEDICKLLFSQYGERAYDILEGYQKVPNLCFQVNSTRYTPEEFIEKYKLNAIPYPPLPFAVKMQEAIPLSGVDFIENGDAFVQDIASQFTSLLLEPQAGMTVIDVCSCPGGKSYSAANLMQRGASKPNYMGQILSCDIHDSKLPLIEKGAVKLNFSFIRTACHDATSAMPEYIKKAERVICDVPCSGLGVIAKKPEIRYKKIDEINALPELQYQILKASAEYLTDDGILVYSTCTVNKKENEDIVTRFLASHTEFTAEDFTFVCENETLKSSNGCLTLFPNENHDGFFMAKIKKLAK